MRTTDPPCTRHIAMPVLSADGIAPNLSISVHGNYSSTRGRNSRVTCEPTLQEFEVAQVMFVNRGRIEQYLRSRVVVSVS
ncbi:hypothetical protein SESBI_15287 [Sesbania bispinosa]|nr:hypothetical protein SESBI_15287 [Sesbania bispinosa]